MGGITGVDYASLPFLLQIHGVPSDMWRDTFDRIQIMVGQAVKQLNPKKK